MIELLVVISIIVLLLSLLAPAMDKAIYQAELVACGANLRTIAMGSITYAAAYKRHYPNREGIYNTTGAAQSWRNNSLATNIPSNPRYDDRPLFMEFMSADAFNDPLCAGKVDFDNLDPLSQVYANYSIWVGWQYSGGHKRMKKIGDKFNYTFDVPNTTADRPAQYDILASDQDTILFTNFSTNLATHQDKDLGLLAPKVLNHQIETGLQWAFSRYENAALGGRFRGPMDRQFAHDDGSVERLEDLLADPSIEERVLRVAAFNYQDGGGYFTALPPAR